MNKKLLTGVAIAMLMMPVVSFAQSSSEDLRAAIQASIMTDPRVSDIPPAQLKALIDSLYSEAQAQHMSAADILWQPQKAAVADAVTPTEQSDCAAGWEGILCQIDHTFGFGGSNYELPIIILVVSGLLIVVLWEFIAHHRRKLEVSGPPVSTPPAPKKVR